MQRILAIVIALGAGFAQAAPVGPSGRTIAVAARITDGHGAPLKALSMDVEVRFFVGETGDTPRGPVKTFPATPVVDGLLQLNVVLTAQEAQDLFAGDDEVVHWQISDQKTGVTYPKQRLNAVPFAMAVPVDGTTIVFENGKLKAVSDGGGGSGVADDAVTGAKILDGSVTNDDVGAGAAIATTKLSGPVTSIPGNGLGALATKSQIADADVAAGAAIADSKLGTIATPGKVSGAAVTSGLIGGTAGFAGSGGVDLKSASGTASELRFRDASNTNYVALKAPAAVGTTTVLTLPSGDGAAGQFLSTDGSGALSWGTPGGAGDMLRSTYDLNDDGVPDAAESLGGHSPAYYLDAGNLAAGTLPAARLPIATNGAVGAMKATTGKITLDGTGAITAINADTAATATSATSAASATSFTGSLAGDVTGTQGATVLGNDTVTSGKIVDGAIMDADVNASAAIATTKLSGPVTSITGNGLGALATKSAVASADITDGSIMDADINAGAAIADSKLATISTAGKVSGSAVTSGTIGGTTGFVASGGVNLRSASGTASELRFSDAANTNYVALKAPAAIGASTVWTLPAGDGTAGQFLRTDGSGALYWGTPTGAGDMLKSTYDGNVDGVVDDAAALGGQPGTYYRDAGNLNAGTIGAARLPIATNGALGAMKATTGRITLDGTGAITGIAADSFSGSLAGDVTGGQGTTSVVKLRGYDVSNAAPADLQVLKWNGLTSKWEPAADANSGGTVTSVVAGTGLTGGTINTSGTIAVDVGTGAGKIPQLDGAGKLVTSTLPLATNGAVGAMKATTGKITLDGTGAITSIAADTATTATSATSAASFTGSLTGDVSGTQGATSVDKLKGRAIAATAPTNGQVLKWNTSTTSWEPAPDADSNSGGTVTGVTAGTGLTGGTINTSGTIAVDVGTAAGKIPQLDGGAKLAASTLPIATNTALGAMKATTGKITLDGTGAITNIAADTATTATSATSATNFSGSLAGEVTGTQGATVLAANTVTSGKIVDGAIMDADVNASAAIATTKLSGAVTSITGHGLGGLATKSAVASADITDGAIMDADINASAAIATTKLSGAVTSIAGNGLGSLATKSAVASADITDGSIMDADINASAAIADSKLATISTAGKVSGGAITSGTIGGSTALSTSGNVVTSGRVVAGTSSTTAKLEVNGGQILSKVYLSTGTTTIDWNQGNLQTTNQSCTTFNMQNMFEGGSYTLIVTGTTSGTCQFQQSSAPDTLLTTDFNFVPANGPTTGGTKTIYTFLRAGNKVYVSWITGY